MNVLAGRIAIVTGASSGIGKAIALMLAEEGVNVCLLGRNEDRLKEVLDTIKLRGGQAEVFNLNVADNNAIKEFTVKLESKFARIDVLIHSAGVFYMDSINSSTTVDFDTQYLINVRGPYYLTQCLLPLIINCQGQIVFINSTAGIQNARASIGQYAATKYALRAIADSIRDELNSKGVKVLSIYPGRTASPMQAEVHAKEGKPYLPEKLIQPEDVANILKPILSLPATVEVTDIIFRPMHNLG